MIESYGRRWNKSNPRMVFKRFEKYVIKKILLICDEVQSGIGRSGSFAFEYGIKPDIVPIAKGIEFPLGISNDKKGWNWNDTWNAWLNICWKSISNESRNAVLDKILNKKFLKNINFNIS